MIVTVTANAAIDRTLRVDRLRPGGRHRVTADRSQAGGKGVNVARVLRALGRPVHAVVLVGGESGDWIVRDLEREGLPATRVPAPGDSRTCIEIVDDRAEVTQLHGIGVAGSRETAEALLREVEARLSGASWLALCGSLPRELPADTYARLVALARRRQVAVAVDTSGEALQAAWAAEPDVVRVNRAEAAEALGVAAERIDAPPPTAPAGARLCVVSDGAEDVFAWTPDGAIWRAVPPRITARNPVGCGDAMLAGLLDALAAEQPLGEALRAAVALGAAEAEAEAAGLARPERARALAAEVGVVRERGPT